MVKVSARSVNNAAIAGPPVTVFPSARKQILGEAASIEGNSWQLFLTDAKIEAADWTDIGQLAATSCNPNPFFNSPFLKPACQFLSNETVNFLALTSINNSGERLCFFAPVTIEKIPFIRKKVLQVWSHPYGPLGTPLLCSMNAAQTLSGLIDCLTNSEETKFAAIIFKDLPKNTVFSSKLFASRTLASRSLRYSAYLRPAFNSHDELSRALGEVTGKRLQRQRVARKNLATQGTLHFTCVTEIDALPQALAEHLELENSGWKGAQKSSILKQNNIHEFTKQILPDLVKEQGCEIHALHVDDKPVSSMIMLKQSGHYFPWKIAFDEAYSEYSVGNLLVTHVNELLAEQPGFKSLDSLASAANKTARRFWPFNHEMSDMVIELGKNAPQTALRIAQSQTYKHSIRQKVKRLLGHSL